VEVSDASTSPPKERYAVSNDNVFKLVQPGTFDDRAQRFECRQHPSSSWSHRCRCHYLRIVFPAEAPWAGRLGLKATDHGRGSVSGTLKPTSPRTNCSHILAMPRPRIRASISKARPNSSRAWLMPCDCRRSSNVAEPLILEQLQQSLAPISNRLAAIDHQLAPIRDGLPLITRALTVLQ
jgi:hypothetical protein